MSLKQIHFENNFYSVSLTVLNFCSCETNKDLILSFDDSVFLQN